MFYNKYPKRSEGKGRGELGTETDINLKQQLVYHVMTRHQVRDPASETEISSAQARVFGRETGSVRMPAAGCTTTSVVIRRQGFQIMHGAWGVGTHEEATVRPWSECACFSARCCVGASGYCSTRSTGCGKL